MNLIIVESPTKCKTIQKFLGKSFLVASSYGHIRDLPKNALGVDIEKDFKPKYVIPQKAVQRVRELKSYLSKTKETILACDQDREGEAIAWHLANVLSLKNPKRIVFHEITKQAIEEALKNPREIDLNLVDAQQARRILDRLVGYKLSPFLWKKIMRGLSAGRVQSVAVRLICDREKEIQSFIPQEYWSVEVLLQKNQNGNAKPKVVSIDEPLKIEETMALLVKKDGEPIDKLGIKNKKEAEKIVQDLKSADYKVIKVEKKETKRNPFPPFTTSTLQQTASSKFHFGVQRTMRVAQNLYEKGLISYHRTDSFNLSGLSQLAAKKFIQENYGKEYWPGFGRCFKTKAKTAQEAHEAIRPTYADNTPEKLKQKAKLTEEQYKLYALIWARFIACQMNQAIFYSSQVDILAAQYTFRATGQTLKFDGFLKVYPIKFEEAELPFLEKNEVLKLKELLPSQHFTQPPPRYSEATLIKVLEKEGIGRPSTYAPILETIQRRNYVEKDENKKLIPTQIGNLVNDLLVQHFPKIIEIKFTAKMEGELDDIAEGKTNWIKTLREFYIPFEMNLLQKEKEVVKKQLTEKTDKTCPKCAGPLIIRLGRYGRFYACSRFPNCKHTESLPKPSLNIQCPKCQQGEIYEKKTKKGKIFYGCANWPICDFALWDKPLPETCPKCKSLLIETKKRKTRPVKLRNTDEVGKNQFNGIKCSNKECNFKKNDGRNNPTN